MNKDERSDVLGRCAQCGGNLTEGHKCPERYKTEIVHTCESKPPHETDIENAQHEQAAEKIFAQIRSYGSHTHMLVDLLKELNAFPKVPESLEVAVREAWTSINGRACLADNFWPDLGREGTNQMVIDRITFAFAPLLTEAKQRTDDAEGLVYQGMNKLARKDEQIAKLQNRLDMLIENGLECEVLDIRCSGCGRSLSAEGEQCIDEGVQDDPNTAHPCGRGQLEWCKPEDVVAKKDKRIAKLENELVSALEAALPGDPRPSDINPDEEEARAAAQSKESPDET